MSEHTHNSEAEDLVWDALLKLEDDVSNCTRAYTAIQAILDGGFMIVPREEKTADEG